MARLVTVVSGQVLSCWNHMVQLCHRMPVNYTALNFNFNQGTQRMAYNNTTITGHLHGTKFAVGLYTTKVLYKYIPFTIYHLFSV